MTKACVDHAQTCPYIAPQEKKAQLPWPILLPLALTVLLQAVLFAAMIGGLKQQVADLADDIHEIKSALHLVPSSKSMDPTNAMRRNQ